MQCILQGVLAATAFLCLLCAGIRCVLEAHSAALCVQLMRASLQVSLKRNDSPSLADENKNSNSCVCMVGQFALCVPFGCILQTCSSHSLAQNATRFQHRLRAWRLAFALLSKHTLYHSEAQCRKRTPIETLHVCLAAIWLTA